MSVAEEQETAIEKGEEDSTTTSMSCDSRIDYCERTWRNFSGTRCAAQLEVFAT